MESEKWNKFLLVAVSVIFFISLLIMLYIIFFWNKESIGNMIVLYIFYALSIINALILILYVSFRKNEK